MLSKTKSGLPSDGYPDFFFPKPANGWRLAASGAPSVTRRGRPIGFCKRTVPAGFCRKRGDQLTNQVAVTVRAGYIERRPGIGYQFFERFSAILADEIIDGHDHFSKS